MIEDGVSAIVDKNRFERVKSELKKNSKTPARHTADDDYLLTTKLFRGKCGAMMVAQAGTSYTGKVHRYYACVRQKKALVRQEDDAQRKARKFYRVQNDGDFEE